MTSAKICEGEILALLRDHESGPSGATHEHEDHGDKDAGLEEVRAGARIADDADRLARREPRQPTAQPCGEVHEAGVERVRVGGVEAADDEDADDEAVDGDDAGHDDGDEGLHDEFGAEGAHAGDADAGLGCPVRGAEGCATVSSGDQSRVLELWSCRWTHWKRSSAGAARVRMDASVGGQGEQGTRSQGERTAAPTPANPKKGAYAGHACVAMLAWGSGVQFECVCVVLREICPWSSAARSSSSSSS